MSQATTSHDVGLSDGLKRSIKARARRQEDGEHLVRSAEFWKSVLHRGRSDDQETRVGAYLDFCGALQVLPKQGGRRNFVLNPIQRERAKRRGRFDVVLKARQVGLTTEECAYDVFHLLTRTGSRVQSVVQSLADHSPFKQVEGIYRVYFDAIERTGLKLGVQYSTGRWRIQALDAEMALIESGAEKKTAEKKGRSGRITRLHATEVAFWDYADATLTAMLQCLPPDGEVSLESTPNGASGPFYQYCKRAMEGGRSTYNFLFFPWYMQPEYRLPLERGETIEPEDEREKQLLELGVSPEALKWRRWKIGDLRGSVEVFDQEFPTDTATCFLIKGLAFFSKDRIISMLRSCADPSMWFRNGLVAVWKQPQRGEVYVIGSDTSEGIQEPGKKVEEHEHDASAGIVRNKRTGEHVATLFGMLRPDALAENLMWLSQYYNGAMIGVERNNHGHAVLLWLVKALNYGAYVFRDPDDGEYGWRTTGPSRAMMLDALEIAVRTHGSGYVVHDKRVVDQQSTFMIRNGKPQATTGAHDDLVMADAISWQLVCMTSTTQRHY